MFEYWHVIETVIWPDKVPYEGTVEIHKGLPPADVIAGHDRRPINSYRIESVYRKQEGDKYSVITVFNWEKRAREFADYYRAIYARPYQNVCPKCFGTDWLCWDEWTESYVDSDGDLWALPVGGLTCKSCGYRWEQVELDVHLLGLVEESEFNDPIF